MTWPSPQDYNEAVQTPAVSFADQQLRDGHAELTPYGLPRAVSGAFASVYRLQTPAGDWALRCFLQHVEDQEKRYKALSEFICHDDLESTVPFEFLAQGVRIHGNWYPVLKMQWVAGETLNVYLERNLKDRSKLEKLAATFKDMCLQLSENGIAHGDLQHGNIMLVADSLRLVDYDGMYVPSLQGEQSNELGHRNYQHPLREKFHFGSYLDNFSAWVIYTSLVALSVQPSLWRALEAGDECLLFRQRDFKEPDCSLAFAALEHCGDERIAALSRTVRACLHLPVERVPGLEAVVDTAQLPAMPTVDAVLQMRKQRAPQQPALGSGWMAGWSDVADTTGGEFQPVGNSVSTLSASRGQTRIHTSATVVSTLNRQRAIHATTPQVTHGPPHAPASLDFVNRYAAQTRDSQSAETNVDLAPLKLFLIIFIAVFALIGRHPQSASDRSAVQPTTQQATTAEEQTEQTEQATDARQSTSGKQAQLMRAAYDDVQKGDYASAISKYSQCIDKYDYANAYYNRGLSYEKLGQYENALTDLIKYIELRPGDASAYRDRADVYHALGMDDEVNKDLQMADRLSKHPLRHVTTSR